MKGKISEWFKRYAVAEIFAILTAILTAIATKELFGIIILSAFVATWSDNIVYYGIIAFNDLKNKKNFGFVTLIKQTRDMIFEFGPAEYLDSFIIRPFYLSVFPYFINNYSLSILIGSVAAGLTFYIPAIVFYEIRKKIFKN